MKKLPPEYEHNPMLFRVLDHVLRNARKHKRTGRWSCTVPDHTVTVTGARLRDVKDGVMRTLELSLV